ncbi:nucleoid occlusion factor SlmA [Endozoicomonas ascidiicola]|uniref:nucleoid occlusion factor SlmA n=1 Tax=Endozoicomonas ascidiicola TaxID=1698521 RepID=UPI000ACFBB7B|nr:nucleoid occlusion factor SlmA [Endozoicomonas ascidiicola]
MDMSQKISRKQQILEALAHMLETAPGTRITTSALAKEVGVSEAALYRHFPSKAKMFEGLIEFIEEALFSRITLILAEEQSVSVKCEKMLRLLLGFCEKNAGLTRILTGDALAGETDRLRQRVIQLFDRLETQLKQTLREAEMKEGVRTRMTVSVTANLMLAAAEGRIVQYVRSEFKRLPTENWADQWVMISEASFR